ncbi:MAG: hypothetical protein JRH20_06135 [Deltaproteobacteria bacterium]|nr:hypothetical protein [Deltaproteobacteria bacterium]
MTMLSLVFLACGEGSVGLLPNTDLNTTDGGATADVVAGGNEICGNHYDDDGDGDVDEECPCNPEETPEQWCYPGPFGTMDVGPCQAGTQYCVKRDEFSYWGECKGGVGPSTEICDDHLDNDCNGTIDDCQSSTTDDGLASNDDGSSTGDGSIGDGSMGDGLSNDGGAADDAGVVPAPDTTVDTTVDTVPGLPPELCGPHSCPGCCDHFGVCHKTPSQQFCALGGVACKPCNAMEQCNAQTGTCEWLFDRKDFVAVLAVSAVVTDNDDCGWFDTCDPYVEVRLNTHYGESGTDIDDESPVWNDVIFNVPRKDLLGHVMDITFMDEDSFLRFDDDEMSHCTVQVTEAHLTAEKVQINCGGDVSNLIFAFRNL